MDRPSEPDGPAALAAKRPGLEIRARLLASIRSYFVSRGFLEVETPVRLAAPALELHIDAEPSGSAWLRTSPELHMKRLLAAGYSRLFQIGPCFRQGERGRLHNPEYTMLEWYRADEAGHREPPSCGADLWCPGAGIGERTGCDNRAILEDVKGLVRQAVREVLGGSVIPAAAGPVRVDGEWAVLTVSEAFTQFAGWDPVTAWDTDRFELDLMRKVEPAMPFDRPCVLTGYPAAAAALARLDPADPRVAERWELYAGGVELCNAYTELIDPAEQEKRFRECAEARRKMGKPVYPMDEEFLAALRRGMPPCAGAALGVDRLAMLLAGADSLDAVIAFREASPHKV